MASIQETIYNQMVTFSPLTDLLSRSFIDETQPAIYEDWAPPETSTPYINMRFGQFEEQTHWAKKSVTLTLAIFTEKDSILTEKIRNECFNCLDRVKLFTDNDVMIRIYSLRDGSIEPNPNLIHWSMEFICFYWRKEFIANLESR